MSSRAGTSSHAQGHTRVLIVDDDLDSAELLQELLQAEGYEVAIAQDGPRAISLATGLRPDGVLLDIHLRATMNGYDVCRQLSALLDRPRRIIAMTGPLAMDEQQFRAAGFDGYVQKPILDTNLVLRVLAGRS
jgi:CheY-like chemotaxis protein